MQSYDSMKCLLFDCSVTVTVAPASYKGFSFGPRPGAILEPLLLAKSWFFACQNNVTTMLQCEDTLASLLPRALPGINEEASTFWSGAVISLKGPGGMLLFQLVSVVNLARSLK